MFTEYGHIKLFSNSPFKSECEVCHKTYMPLSVRSHLRTKAHQKNAIEFAHLVKKSACACSFRAFWRPFVSVPAAAHASASSRAAAQRCASKSLSRQCGSQLRGKKGENFSE